MALMFRATALVFIAVVIKVAVITVIGDHCGGVEQIRGADGRDMSSKGATRDGLAAFPPAR